MRLLVNITADYVADAETVIEVPDSATPEEIRVEIDRLAGEKKINFPEQGDAERIASTMTVHRILRETEDDFETDDGIEACERNW